jgi:hypothetical protein
MLKSLIRRVLSVEIVCADSRSNCLSWHRSIRAFAAGYKDDDENFLVGKRLSSVEIRCRAVKPRVVHDGYCKRGMISFLKRSRDLTTLS